MAFRLLPLSAAALLALAPVRVFGHRDAEAHPTPCLVSMLVVEGIFPGETAAELWNTALRTRQISLDTQGIDTAKLLADFRRDRVAVVHRLEELDFLTLAHLAPTTFAEIRGAQSGEVVTWIEATIRAHRKAGTGHRLVIRFPPGSPHPPHGWLRGLLPWTRAETARHDQYVIFWIEPQTGTLD